MLLVGAHFETCTERYSCFSSTAWHPSPYQLPSAEECSYPMVSAVICSQCQLVDASPFSLLSPHPGLPPIQTDTQEGDTDRWSHDAGGSHCGSTQAVTVSISPSWDGEDPPAWQVLTRATVSHFADHLRWRAPASVQHPLLHQQ